MWRTIHAVADNGWIRRPPRLTSISSVTVTSSEPASPTAGSSRPTARDRSPYGPGILRQMAISERIERTLEREAPAWGVRPTTPRVPPLRGIHFAVLWGDLALGPLVLVTAALLVPALGLPEALLAIVVGTALGCVPLALVGRAGAREGVPGMVLLRPTLRTRGA